MRKSIITAVTLFSVFFLCGCYESEVPLSKPSEGIDPGLIKSWISIPEEERDGEIRLVFRKFNRNEYLIAWKEGNDETLTTRGFVTGINGTKIINVQNISSLEKKERTYLFFRYHFRKNGNLVVSILSDDFPGINGRKFTTPEAFKRVVRKNILKKELFTDEIEFKATKNLKMEIRQP